MLSYANGGATSLFTTVEDLAQWIGNFEDGRTQNGQDFTADRLEGAPPAPDQLDQLAGDYYSDELGATYTLVVQKGKLVAQHRRHDDIALTPTEKDRFHGDAWWFGQVNFQRGPHQEITGFRLTGGRVRNLWFERRPRTPSAG